MRGSVSTKENVFFDLDGTLTDPKPGITGCIQYALERLDAPVPTKDALEWCIGPPLLANFEKLVGAKQAPRGVELYRERFGDVGLFENEVYDGIPEVLAEAQSQGRRLFVASSKPLVFVERILDHFDLTRYLDETLGSELDGTRSDKRDLLGYALEKTGVNASASMMIGDRGPDAVGALHNGMEFLGVLYGYGDEPELREAGTEQFAESPRDLARWIYG